MQYLLLPFTHGVDGPAITYALTLAQQQDAMLILLSLIQRQENQQSVRWEDMQQSTDIMEFTQHKATRMRVSLKLVELHTQNTVRSIRTFAQEIECAGILLFVREGDGVLLTTYEVKQLLEDRRYSFYIAKLPARKPWFSLPRWFTRDRTLCEPG